jgi:large repetitive protein
VDVTNTAGTPCQNASNVVTFVCPTGSIQLFQNPGVALNDFPNAQNANATSVARLNDRGFAEDQPIQLAPGSYHLSATYTADANSSFNSSSTSNTVAVTVTQATTTTTVTPSVTSIASGGSVTLTAKVNTNSNGAGPTGTVQFKNGSSNLGSAVTCTPTAGIASSSGNALCTATLTTALSQVVPLTGPQPRLRIPVLPLWIAAWLVILFLALAQHAARLQRRWPYLSGRLGYAAAGLVLLACVAAGFAGCSGTKGSSSGPHTDSITAVYSGDVNYAGSTSTAVTVAIQ